MSIKHSVKIFALVALTLSGALAHAESARREGGGDVARAQNMVRQVTQERDALRSENLSLQEQIKKLTADLAKAKKEASGIKAGAAEADAQSKALLDRYKQTDAGLRERITAQNDKMQQLVDKYKELVATLRDVESQRAVSQDMVVSQARELDRCVENNIQLYQTGLDVLTRYEKKGVWESLVQAEPVTQINRVKIENLVQDYRGRLLNAKVDAPLTAAASPTSAVKQNGARN